MENDATYLRFRMEDFQRRQLDSQFSCPPALVTWVCPGELEVVGEFDVDGNEIVSLL